MAVETIALGSQVQAGSQALKLAIESDAVVVEIVTEAASGGGSAYLSSPSTTSTNSSRLLDIVV